MLPTTALVFAALNIFAQGTVFFNNRTVLSTSHVWGSSAYISLTGPSTNDTPPGLTPYEAAGMVLIGAHGTGGLFGAATTCAQLLAAPGANAPESSLVPMGQTTTFRTGTAAGFLAPITSTLEGIAPDAAAATLEMVAWDNRSGLYPTWTQAYPAWVTGQLVAVGKSGPFTVYQIGGLVNTPPNLPIPSFNIYVIPEPSLLALAGLGAAALAATRRVARRQPEVVGGVGTATSGQRPW